MAKRTGSTRQSGPAVANKAAADFLQRHVIDALGALDTFTPGTSDMVGFGNGDEATGELDDIAALHAIKKGESPVVDPTMCPVTEVAKAATIADPTHVWVAVSNCKDAVSFTDRLKKTKDADGNEYGKDANGKAIKKSTPVKFNGIKRSTLTKAERKNRADKAAAALKAKKAAQK